MGAQCNQNLKANPPQQNPKVGVSPPPFAKGELGHHEIRKTPKGICTELRSAKK